MIRSFRFIIFIGFVLASLVADGIAAGAFNINVLPREFVQIVEQSPNILNVLGLEYWKKILDVSNAVQNEGLMGVSEEIYLPLGIQRLIIEKVRTAAGVPEDVRFVLLDALTQYYVYTYYYEHPDPRQKAFLGEHKAFLDNLGVEFEWVEPAGENYYLHTFLRRLVRELPDTKWGRFYRAVKEETGLNDISREREGEAEPAVTEDRSEVGFEAEISEAQRFEKPFGPGFLFILEPSPLGWRIMVKQENRDEDLSRLTPPFHFVPNPREVEGWHFRNADNTRPNAPGEKNVNAPGEEREFIFSPEVGLTIDAPGTGRPPSAEEINAVRTFGRGKPVILAHKLAGLEPGAQARVAWMKFRVELTWALKSQFGGNR
jgi:hypothetical protein